MRSALQVTRLHLSKKAIVFTVPAAIMLFVVLIMVLIALILQRIGVEVGTPQWEQGFQNNGAALWSFPGFFVYLGVQAVSTTFPYAMALGTTRRSFSSGTALFFVIQSIYVSLVALVLSLLERITGGWFVSGYVFDVVLLGSGNSLKLVMMIFATSFFALSAGALFGATFVKMGTKGPLYLGVSLALAVGILLLAFAPVLSDVVDSMTIVRAAFALLALAAIGTVGQYLALRAATVR